MSVSRKVLRKMKKVMGVIGASASLIPMYSQVSFAAKKTIWVDKQNGNYVSYNLDEEERTLTISGSGVVTSSWQSHAPSLFSYKKVVIEYGIREIGEKAFEGKNVVDVDIPDSVTVIGERAFFATFLENLYLPDSVIRIGSYAFANTYLENVFISNKVEVVGDFAFANCKLLKKVTFNHVDNPGTKFSIGDSVFCNCGNLKLFSTGYFDYDKNIDNYRIVKLRSNVFYGCDKLFDHANNKRIQGFIDCENKNYKYRLVLKR